MKQLEPGPWENVAARYPIGVKCTGRVTNITSYGAFVEIGDGLSGLIHVSNLTWSENRVISAEVVSMGQEFEVMVLEIDQDKRCISLGLKQCIDKP